MIQTPDPRQRVWWYFLIAYAFSWFFWIPQALEAHTVALPPPISAFLAGPLNPAAFGPLVAALTLTISAEGWKGALRLLQRGLDFRFKKAWLLAILLLPPLIFAGGILLSMSVGATPPEASMLFNPMVALIGFVIILFTAGPLQEEFGWRGYALPRLQSRFSPLVSSLILGGLWWLWHLPLVFIPGRFMVNNLGLFLVLLVEIELTSILFTWIYNHTGGNVLAALLFHTSMNWSIWIVLPSMQMNLSILGLTILLLALAAGVVLALRGVPARSPEQQVAG